VTRKSAKRIRWTPVARTTGVSGKINPARRAASVDAMEARKGTAMDHSANHYTRWLAPLRLI
jgi:hypothetical protein